MTRVAWGDKGVPRRVMGKGGMRKKLAILESPREGLTFRGANRPWTDDGARIRTMSTSGSPFTPKPFTMRIAVLHFSHETVTFLPNDTEVDDFVYPGSPCKDEALLDTDANPYIAGFVQCAREFHDVALVGIESPMFPKTGIGSGWVTHAAFEQFVGVMLAELAQRGPFDGVYMALHGAMAVRGIARPEAELAQRVRKVVGPRAVMAATFDPHGNEDAAFLQAANLAFCVKYYPHYDAHLQGERAARTLVRTIRGDYLPTSHCIKVPILTPTVMQWTGSPPWMALVQRALTWEARKPGTCVNVYFGFPWADTVDAGMAIQVTTHADAALARTVAEDMATAAWNTRASLVATAQVHPIDEGVALALAEVARGNRPAVIADHSDRSGAATWVLKALLAQGARRTLIASITDGHLVTRPIADGTRIGDPFDHAVGGRVDASAGDAVRISGTVVAMGDATHTSAGGGAWLAIGFGDGNVLVLCTYLMQVTNPATLKHMGLGLQDIDVYAIKSRVHFREGFHDSGFAPCIVLVEPDAPFLGTTRLEGLPYAHLKLEDFYPYGLAQWSVRKPRPGSD